MAGVNKAILVGRLGRDPEVRYMPDGRAVASFSIATSDEWKDKNTGEKRERTEWHRIVAFDKLGEICGEYLSKGRQVYIEGRIQTRDWEDNNGVKRYTTEIVAWQMQMLGSRGDYESARPSPPPPRPSDMMGPSASGPQQFESGPPPVSGSQQSAGPQADGPQEDDIPF